MRSQQWHDVTLIKNVGVAKLTVTVHSNSVATSDSLVSTIEFSEGAKGDDSYIGSAVQ